VFLAAYALSAFGVDRVLVVPTFQHAFDKPLTAMDHRLAMCERAFGLLRGVEVSPLERELGGTSRTLRLLTALGPRYPDHQLRLLVGTDILRDAPRWHRFDEVCRLAPPMVADRAGYAREAVTGEAPGPAAPLLPEVSSTVVRERLARGEDVSLWVPHAVRAYIEAHGLYRASTP